MHNIEAIDNCSQVPQAEKETTLLREINLNVERWYHQGRPLHHHESARRKEFDSATTLSDIFVAGFEDFGRMSPGEVMNVFRHRHMLVIDCPYKDEGFVLSTFDKLLNVRQLVDLHGEFVVCTNVHVSN